MRSRLRHLFAAFLASLAAAAPAAAQDTLLSWFDAAGEPRWTVAAAVPESTVQVPLTAEPWFWELPAIEIPMLDGTVYDTSSARGKVLVLDFWATWCPPCIEELPHLQQLARELADEGLEAVAVNAQEPVDVVREFAEQIDLSLPIGYYVSALDRLLEVSSLPTVVMLDRRGRVRFRMSGYSEGYELRLADKARALVSGNDEGARPRAVAEVLHGAGTMLAAWEKKTRTTIEDVAIVKAAEGLSRIALTRPGEVVLLDSGGVRIEGVPIPGSAGRLLVADLDAEEADDLVVFRPGADRITVILEASPREIRVPAPVLDVAPDAAGSLWLATLRGVFRTSPPEFVPEQVEDTGRTTGVAPFGEGAGPWLAVTPEAGVALHAADGDVIRRQPVPGAWGLVRARAGDTWGVTSGTVRSTAVGSFWSAGSEQVAIAHEGMLRVVDTADGTLRFAARWPDLGSLAAGDLDGDGIDELVVTSGNRLYLLRAID